jgi:hypothetical protein
VRRNTNKCQRARDTRTEWSETVIQGINLGTMNDTAAAGTNAQTNKLCPENESEEEKKESE